MSEIISPSVGKEDKGITPGQIGKIQELYGAGLRKAGLQSKAIQFVLENQGAELVDALVAVVRGFVKVVSNMISRFAKVDRSLSPEQVIDATKRNKYVSDEVVKTIPLGTGEKVYVHFFKLGQSVISDDDLEKEYEKRGLVPDPRAQAAVNAEDPAFADSKPNGTHWKDANGNWCFLAFFKPDGKRRVGVDHNRNGWYDDWWFGGVCKSSIKT